MRPWMVVEDEDDIRNIVKIMFEAWGHPAIEFRDGNQSFKWLDSVEDGSFNGELPELALMDIRMPGPRGNEIAARMRTLDQFKEIPIVLMTAFSLTDSERKSFHDECGVDHIIAKPLPDFLELKSLLEKIQAEKTTA